MRAGWLLFLILLLKFTVQAQSAPTIEYFTVDKPALNYAAVEAGTETANFSWRVHGLREGDEMQMHAWVGGQWGLIGAGFEPEKTDTLVIAHPLDFVLPQYRLSVVDEVGVIVTEQILELAYAPPEGLPVIRMFLAFPPAITIPLDAFDEPLHVQWQVTNRWYNSNLVFEQVMPDGTVRSAEYARPVEWQYAHKDDYVIIEYPGDYADVVLQLRVVDLDDGSTLAQQQLILYVVNDVAAQPELVNFTVTPETIDPGDTVTLTWDVVNTDKIFIEYEDGFPNGRCAGYLEQVYELSPTGSLDITAPEAAFRSLQFRVFADFRLPGSRHHCGSFQTPLAEAEVNLTDYIGQGVEYFRIEPTHARIGDTITLSWSVSEGESVTITYPNRNSMDITITADSTTFADLPLTGTLDVTIPDEPEIMDALWDYFWLYIIEDGEFPTVTDSSVSVIYIHDEETEQ